MQIASSYANNSEHGYTNNSDMYCLVKILCLCFCEIPNNRLSIDNTMSNSSYVGHIDCQLRH